MKEERGWKKRKQIFPPLAIGRHWETLGHLVDSQLCLHPEEALFLMESNNLVVSHGGVAMSMQVTKDVQYSRCL